MISGDVCRQSKTSIAGTADIGEDQDLPDARSLLSTVAVRGLYVLSNDVAKRTSDVNFILKDASNIIHTTTVLSFLNQSRRSA